VSALWLVHIVPHYDIELDASLPETAEYLLPRGNEITEEGFGFFRDTWAIPRLLRTEACAIIKAERTLLEVADRVASTADEFEAVCAALESGDDNVLPDGFDSGAAHAEIEPNISEEVSLLGGLDLGVAGLVAALSAIGGIRTAASCRSHGSRSWSPHPVVLFAADRYRAERLQPLVQATGCGFAIDGARPQLLCIVAPSVSNLAALAATVLDSAATFRRPRGSKKQGSTQLDLFEIPAPDG
jgi:hypothetical protein